MAIHEVDAHNVVPLWVASEKLEYSAKTLRSKINKRLPDYLIDFPVLQPPCKKWAATANQSIDWESLFEEVARSDISLIQWSFVHLHDNCNINLNFE